MEKRDIDHLIALSAYCGSSLKLVQAGGGNTSVKDDQGQAMSIKASGFRLSEMTQKRGHVTVSIPALLSMLEDSSLSTLSPAEAQKKYAEVCNGTVIDGSRLRPSIEAGFHAFMPKVVAHTHPIIANVLACTAEGRHIADEIFDFPFLWVKYAPPGFALTLEVYREWNRNYSRNRPESTVIILENHGLITGDIDSRGVISLMEKALSRIEGVFGKILPDSFRETVSPGSGSIGEKTILWAEKLGIALEKACLGRSVAVRPSVYEELCSYGRHFEKTGLAEPLVPDDVVYWGSRIHTADESMEPGQWLEDNFEHIPEKMAILLKGRGLILTGPGESFLRAMEENLLANLLIRRLALKVGRLNPLSSAEVAYLDDMESEKYRQKILAGQSRKQ